MNVKLVQLQQMDDQLWQGIKERQGDLDRIARMGLTSADDHLFIKMVCHFLMARILTEAGIEAGEGD